MTAKRALVAIGRGSEEIETATVADVLVRAGADVTVASVEESASCTMSRGMTFTADTTVADLPADASYDAIVLPGGMPGAERLRDCDALVGKVKAALDGEKCVVAAICAAPAVVLGTHGLLAGRAACCYPAPPFVEKLGEGYVDVGGGDVVVSKDGKLVTSRGPATAMAFALALVERLYGGEMKDKLAGELLYG